MTYEEFNKIVMENDAPIILVEGTRDLPEKDVAVLSAFGKWLAGRYPHARFRTGNADGSDTAFARGIAAVDQTRLEYVVPYAGHRNKTAASSAYQIPLTQLPRVAEERARYHTSRASPEYDSLVGKRFIPKLKAKARYILRDTIKVIGAPESSLPPATIGIFYVNRDNPMKGGTGHTIRVCRQQGVPLAFQGEWMKWPARGSCLS